MTRENHKKLVKAINLLDEILANGCSCSDWAYPAIVLINEVIHGEMKTGPRVRQRRKK